MQLQLNLQYYFLSGKAMAHISPSQGDEGHDQSLNFSRNLSKRCYHILFLPLRNLSESET